MAELAVNDKAVTDNARWNFGVSFWDVTFIMLGVSLVSRETVMPVLVAQLTSSKLALGLIPAIFSLGGYLPQLLFANFTERLRYKKPFTMWIGGLGERGPYLLMALTIWWLAGSAPALALVVFFCCLAATATALGAATPAWFDMIAKVIPVQRRGLYAGLGHGLGALMGVVGAYFVGRILATVAFPNNFALLFGLAFAIMAISWLGLALTREPPSKLVKAQLPLMRYLRQLPAILRRDRNYQRFLICRTIIQMGTMAGGFFMVYGIERFQIDGAGIGLLTAVLVAGQAVMGLIWGVLADRVGHKRVLATAAFALALAALAAWMADSQTWLVVTFALLGAYMAADTASGLNIILEFCAPEDRPTYIGLTNTLLAPVLTLAPLLGGWLSDDRRLSGSLHDGVTLRQPGRPVDGVLGQ